MSREGRAIDGTGKTTVYAHLFSGDELLIYNGVTSAFELPSAVSATDWANAASAFACTEEALPTAEKLSLYVCDLPAGVRRHHPYVFVFQDQSGETKATTDPIIGKQSIDAADSPSCIQTAINDAASTTTGATLDFIDPLPNALVGWLLTVFTAGLVGETVAISASTAAGHVTFAELSAAPADDALVLLTPPARSA
jgi:hypothetical protein